jgi:hypothetical protein
VITNFDENSIPSKPRGGVELCLTILETTKDENSIPSDTMISDYSDRLIVTPSCSANLSARQEGGATLATARKVAALPQWRITMIGKKGERFGIVEAVNAESAIKIAAEKFGIPDPRRRRRLVATRIDEES